MRENYEIGGHADGCISNPGAPTEIWHSDGRVELADEESIKSSPLFNEDLAPVAVARRNWTTYNYAALWMSMSACIPTYMLSSGLIASGMNWWQALLTILIGNTIVLAPILLNSHSGTKYGIPFPVFARASYGTIGSNLPALMRAVVACGWFGIQTWIGGEAVFTLVKAIFPGIEGTPSAFINGYSLVQWLSFMFFWCINIFVIVKGMDMLKKIENLAAPFVMLMTFLLLIWAVSEAKGLGQLMEHGGKYHTFPDFMRVFIPSLSAMIGFWATLSLNMPDFTRFGRSQKEQAIGQVVALPSAMTIFSTMGVIITSAAIVIYPDAPLDVLWNPNKLIGQFKDPLVVAISMFTVAVATLAVNIAANVVSPANDFANAFPRYISFRTGGIITGVLGILMQPWKLIADPSGFIFQWLQGYSGGLGSIAAVMIVDYWLVKKTQLKLADLYRSEGGYRYAGGWNWAAVVATLLGCGCAWIGMIVPQLKGIYDYAWFVGFGVSAVAYMLFMKFSPEEKKTADSG